MKAESYSAKSGTIATLTEEEKNLIKHLYLDKGLSMSNTSRSSSISLGIVQKFIKLEGISRDRLKAIKMKGKSL
jgi:hypothetical protein